jgi:hypothetical protein
MKQWEVVMALNTNTIAMISVLIGVVGMGWAIFWPVHAQPGKHPVSTHWDIVYVDDDGIMQFTLVRVIKVNIGTRRMTAWCSTQGAERVFKLGKIVKATDVRNGSRIHLAHLMDEHNLPSLLTSPVASFSTGQRAKDAEKLADSGGWWSASRLGLH